MSIQETTANLSRSLSALPPAERALLGGLVDRMRELRDEDLVVGRGRDAGAWRVSVASEYRAATETEERSGPETEDRPQSETQSRLGTETEERAGANAGVKPDMGWESE